MNVGAWSSFRVQEARALLWEIVMGFMDQLLVVAGFLTFCCFSECAGVSGVSTCERLPDLGLSESHHHHHNLDTNHDHSCAGLVT